MSSDKKEWVKFKKLPKPADRKTDTYQVLNPDGSVLLGKISWYASWRRFVFAPTLSIFDPDCMDAISAFMRNLMEQRKTPTP